MNGHFHGPELELYLPMAERFSSSVNANLPQSRNVDLIAGLVEISEILDKAELGSDKILRKY